MAAHLAPIPPSIGPSDDPTDNARAPTPFHLPRPSDYQMSAPGPAGARRIRRALLANGAPPNCKLLGVGPLAADFEDAEHRIDVFQIVDARAQCSDRSGKVPAQHQRESRLRVVGGERQRCRLAGTRRPIAFQSLGQFEMVAERSNWRFCLAFGRIRLVGCWRSVDEVVAKLTAGELERGVPRGRGGVPRP